MRACSSPSDSCLSSLGLPWSGVPVRAPRASNQRMDPTGRGRRVARRWHDRSSDRIVPRPRRGPAGHARPLAARTALQ